MARGAALVYDMHVMVQTKGGGVRPAKGVGAFRIVRMRRTMPVS